MAYVSVPLSQLVPPTPSPVSPSPFSVSASPFLLCKDVVGSVCLDSMSMVYALIPLFCFSLSDFTPCSRLWVHPPHFSCLTFIPSHGWAAPHRMSLAWFFFLCGPRWSPSLCTVPSHFTLSHFPCPAVSRAEQQGTHCIDVYILSWLRKIQFASPSLPKEGNFHSIHLWT